MLESTLSYYRGDDLERPSLRELVVRKKEKERMRMWC